jgi:hypothetical protein
MAQVQRPRADASVFDSSGSKGLMQLGQAVSGAGEQLSEIAIQEIKRRETMRMVEAMQQINTEYSEFELNARQNAKPGESVKVIESSHKWLEERKAKLQEEFKSPFALEWLSDRYGDFAVNAMKSVGNWDYAESRKHALQLAENEVTKAIEDFGDLNKNYKELQENLENTPLP